MRTQLRQNGGRDHRSVEAVGPGLVCEQGDDTDRSAAFRAGAFRLE
jgi:hypothetical protein